MIRAPDPETTASICAFIRAGSFPHVAAEAAGVSPHDFNRWLTKKTKKCQDFVKAIRAAQAQARVTAEISVLKDEPLAWLRSGPGKETQAQQGWTVPVKPSVTHDNRTVNLMLSPEIMSLFGAILQVLAPYPEARAAVAQALAQIKQPSIENKPS